MSDSTRTGESRYTPTRESDVHKPNPTQSSTYRHTHIHTHIPYSITSGLLRRKDTIPELSVCLQADVKSVMMRSS
jgi:hypothetical protein